MIGLSLVAICEILLAVDVRRRGGIVIGPAFPDPGQLAQPVGAWAYLARWMAFNMTALCWVAYLLIFDGLLEWWGAQVRNLKRRCAG